MTKMQGNRRWAAVGVAAILMMLAGAVAAPAQGFRTLVNLNGTDGANPQYISLVQGTDGNLYGTTQSGGLSNDGTIFKVTPTGAVTTLYSFCAQTDCADGRAPLVGLTLGSDGNFYGTTYVGGSATCSGGCGTVFRITPEGLLTTLHQFNVIDGDSPLTRLVQAKDGNFYGTAESGGPNDGVGTVFRITPRGKLTTLHAFSGTDGSNPVGGLVQGADGDFYGTTYQGGAYGMGTAFRMTPTGTLTTLHSFDTADGAFPWGGLMQGTDGNLYGTTYSGGTNDRGTIFKMTPGGTLTTLGSGGGSYPRDALIEATDRRLYGTTSEGGAGQSCSSSGCGTIFGMTTGGIGTTLYSFDGGKDGAIEGVYCGLLQATDGRLYGTTAYGGTYVCTGSTQGCGTIFSLSVGLAPFVETLPTFGKIGATIRILGTNLKGASQVSFNGTPAAFKVVSSSLVSTTVPTGATTGPVQVVTPSGTLTSNVNFRVE